MNQKPINISSSGDNVIHDVGTADKNVVFDYTLIAAGAVTAILKDEAGVEFARYAFGAAGNTITAGPPGMGESRFTATGNIIINLSGAVAVTGHFTYATRNG